MTRMALAAAVVLGLAGFAPAHAQYWHGHAHGYGYGPGFGGGVGYRSGFSIGGPGFRVGAYSYGFYAGPLVPYYPWVPLYGPGYGPGYGNPYFLPPPGGAYPPVVVVPPPIVVFGGAGIPGGIVEPAGGIPPLANNAPPIGAKPGDFVVISPNRNKVVGAAASGPGTITPMIDRVAPPPMPVKPPAFDPFANRPVFANTDRPEADPAAESARQLRLARTAFAAEEYGLAADHFGLAIRAKPDEPQAYFLRAQAHFAAGRYSDAVADIRDGMKKAPDWPAAKFDAKALYGPATDRFDAHLAALRKALFANPADPALHFLLGYELWFSGDRPAAAKAFLDAAKLAPGNAMIDRFLGQ
jgi:hypothetical protein